MRKQQSLIRKICLLICASLALTTLSSCGSNVPKKDSVSTESTTQSKTDTTDTKEDVYTYTGSAPVTKEKQKLSILTTNAASLVYDFDNMAWWQEILKRANIEIEMELIDASSYGDVVKPRLAAATDLPDIMQLAGMDNDMAYIDSGIFQDLTQFYEKYAYNLNEQFKDNPALKSELTTPDGKIFYVPYIYLTKDWARCIMVNQPWLDALGKKQPTTTDELYEVLKAIKSTDLNKNGKNDEVPLFMREGMTQLFGTLWGLDLMSGFGVDTTTGKATCSYTQPAYLDFLTYFNKLYKEGLLYNEFPTADYDTQTALFANNQVGLILHYMSNCTGYSSQINPEWKMNVDTPIMQPIAPPKGPNGDAYYCGRDGLGAFFGITKECKNPELAFQFMDYLYSKEATELSWYGFEGTDYVLEGTAPKFSDVYLENKDSYRSNMGYNFSGFPSVQIAGSYGATQCKEILDANSRLREFTVNPIGFSFNLPNEIETIQAYRTDLDTYFAEMFVAFITGTTPLSDWDKYIKNVESMHVNEITDVYQAIIDRQAKSSK